MIAYIGILEKEPGALWGIWFPDLTGCVAAAATCEDVVAQAGPALQQWLELTREDGSTVPRPRTIEDLRQLPDVAEALAKGDAAILVTLPVEDGLDDQTLARVDMAAERRGLSRTAYLREAVLEKLAS